MEAEIVESSQETLIERCLNGDSRACGQLLSCSEYQQKVERIARNRTRGSSVFWEDAAQTAHEKVLKALNQKKFCLEKGDFYYWATTVALNEIIDLLRKEKNQLNWTSLDQNIPGTDIPLLETIPDDFNLLDAVAQADLIVKANKAIAVIDRRYPNRGYLKLWQGYYIQGKTQTILATEWGITQGAINKRLQEFKARVAEELGLLPTEIENRFGQATRNQKVKRTRSDLHW